MVRNTTEVVDPTALRVRRPAGGRRLLWGMEGARFAQTVLREEACTAISKRTFEVNCRDA